MFLLCESDRFSMLRDYMVTSMWWRYCILLNVLLSHKCLYHYLFITGVMIKIMYNWLGYTCTFVSKCKEADLISFFIVVGLSFHDMSNTKFDVCTGCIRCPVVFCFRQPTHGCHVGCLSSLSSHCSCPEATRR